MSQLREVLKSCLRMCLRILFVAKENLPVLAGPLRGYRLPRQRGLTQLSMIFGRYERGFTKQFLTYVPRKAVIYDIGANFGYFSLLASTNEQAQVVAFEPVPALQAEFKAVIEANQLNARVQLVSYAVSNKSGKVRIVTPGSDETGLMEAALQGQSVDDKKTIEVPSISLDDFVNQSTSEPPGLIKIDVEGAEAMVLEGAAVTIKTHQPIILIEVHGRKPAREVWAVAARLGYHLSRIDEHIARRMGSEEAWMNHFETSKWHIAHVLLTPKP